MQILHCLSKLSKFLGSFKWHSLSYKDAIKRMKNAKNDEDQEKYPAKLFSIFSLHFPDW